MTEIFSKFFTASPFVHGIKWFSRVSLRGHFSMKWDCWFWLCTLFFFKKPGFSSVTMTQLFISGIKACLHFVILLADGWSAHHASSSAYKQKKMCLINWSNTKTYGQITAQFRTMYRSSKMILQEKKIGMIYAVKYICFYILFYIFLSIKKDQNQHWMDPANKCCRCNQSIILFLCAKQWATMSDMSFYYD